MVESLVERRQCYRWGRICACGDESRCGIYYAGGVGSVLRNKPTIRMSYRRRRLAELKRETGAKSVDRQEHQTLASEEGDDLGAVGVQCG
jgi:hypothetical protein